MTHEINITPENHGYTIRLIKRSFENIEGKGSVETSETISCLMIENDRQQAMAAFEILNTFITASVKAGIISEDAFRYKQLR